MTDSKTENYTKEMTPFYSSIPLNIVYTEYPFEKYPKEETICVQELENLNVLDVNRYKKKELKQKIGNFILIHDYLKLKGRIHKLKMNSIET
jgi:hypothetical protein